MNTTTQTDPLEELESALENLVRFCNQSGDYTSNATEVIHAEAVLEQLHKSRRAQLAAPDAPGRPAPVKPEDHPDSQAMRWSDCEVRWIAKRDAQWAALLTAAPAAPAVREGGEPVVGLKSLANFEDAELVLLFDTEENAQAFMARFEPTVDSDITQAQQGAGS